MGDQTKYGYCVVSERWVPRDEMLSINVKVYGADGEETKIPIRVSPDAFEGVVDRFKDLAWDNELMTAAELKEEFGVEV